MCGRARCTLRADDIPRACYRTTAPSRTVNTDRYRPSYNVSPGAILPVVYRDEDGGGDSYAVHCMNWGLVPSFTKKTEKPDFFKMFNARSESVGEKASFRRLLPKSRCLVALEGFYEWKKDGSKKQPYYIHFKDGRPLVFASLYDSWKNSEGEILYTFTILTTSSSSALQWLHDRMPVILGDKEATDIWLSASSSSNFNTLLKPYESSDLVWYPVTPEMGKTSFNGPECIKEIQLKTESKSTLAKFFAKKESKEEQRLIPKKEIKEEKEHQEPISNEIKEVKYSNLGKSALDRSVKVEHQSIEKLETPPTQTSEHDVKPNVSLIPCEDDIKGQMVHPNVKSHSPTTLHESETKSQTKRTHEEQVLSQDKNANVKQQGTARKKPNLKSDGDKQPTLLSFFSKK